MSNGFSAADMSTAAANGHAEGYQAGYADAVKAVEAGKDAAAQEAVAYNAGGIELTACQLHEALLMAGSPELDVEFDDRSRVRIFHTENGHSGPGLYCECVDVEEEGCILLDGTSPAIAAPVAAAPVVDVATLRALSDRWANDRSYTGSPVDDIRALIEQPTTSTPAAPGIDLQWLVEGLDEIGALSRNLRQGGCDADDLAGLEAGLITAVDTSHELLERLLALIDASPKGGSDGLPLIARSIAEWHEDDGPVTWWAWCGKQWAGEPAWVGSPTDSDWPGYHTHWTAHPSVPATNAMQATSAEVGA